MGARPFCVVVPMTTDDTITSRRAHGSDVVDVAFRVGDRIIYRTVRAGDVKAIIVAIDPNVYPEITLRVTSTNVWAYPRGKIISSSATWIFPR